MLQESKSEERRRLERRSKKMEGRQRFTRTWRVIWTWQDGPMRVRPPGPKLTKKEKKAIRKACTRQIFEQRAQKSYF
jgi:hypothetical protein